MSEFREFQDGEVVPGTRYRVCRLIGTGGMGRVYEVEHVELGKRFVLKSLQRELSRRDDLVARLRNEWRALARLEHPNIVNVTDAGTSENGVPFYVMERLEGETLGALLHRQRRLPPQQALAIASGILEGLHAAHQIGVVHRDVKPPNVFLTAGAVKILDFGIAKIKDAKDVITARGIAVGTPRYMSPEQAQGSTVDARSDIYATGLMLFEMVSGVGPFDDAKDHNQLLLAHLGRKAPLLSSISVVAPELDAIVAGMLAKDPRERPPSARVVAETLRALSGRYAHFVGTEVPTINVTPRPAAALEPPTRVEGRRAPAAPPAATRPDGVAAQGARAQARTESATDTAVQPLIEVATTAAHPLPLSGATQRLPELPFTPAPLYGPDTLVERTTQAPTAVPAPAPERTEMLLVAPPAPGASPTTDPGPTRTFVPAVDAPNLTPPPVVPSVPQPSGNAAPRRRLALALSLVALVGVALAFATIAGLRGARGGEGAAASAPPARAVAAEAPLEPAPLEKTPPAPAPPVPAPPPSSAAPEASSEPLPALLAPAASPPSPAPAAVVPAAQPASPKVSAPGVTPRKSGGSFLGSLPPAKAAAALHPAPGVKERAAASMPGSGL